MTSVRGALIVIEGCDRAGKTTQCRQLVSNLKKCNISAEYMNFPDRSTPTGKLINSYLTKKEEFPDQAIHLLFSANRWELMSKIKTLLQQGTTLIIDRYAFSGVAFSVSKNVNGMDLDWCKGPDTGLPKPDLVLLLTLSPEAMKARGGYGEERYEKDDIQRKVNDVFQNMKDSTWKEIDADKSLEDLQNELLSEVKASIEQCKGHTLKKLW